MANHPTSRKRQLRVQRQHRRAHLRVLRQRATLKVRRRHFGRFGRSHVAHRPPGKSGWAGTGLRPYQKLRTRFPAKLDLIGNTKESVEFFSALKAKILYDPADEVVIDHGLAKSISPDAALVLIAELMRANKINPGCRLAGAIANNPHVDGLLGEIGYFDYFTGASWQKATNHTKLFLHHKCGNRTQGIVVKELIEHFAPVLNLSSIERKTLYIAIVECMENVLLHAYPRRHSEPHLINQWWSLGYRDSSTHEVSFCFFDQGIGIPNTIRTRFKDRLPLLSPKDNDLILRAVMEGHYSRTKLQTRGKGLPALKAFIDHASSGEVVIITENSKCTFAKGVAPSSETLPYKFGGTLISWTLRT